jgi:hypothetical protein
MTNTVTTFNIFSGKINFDGTNIIASLLSGDTILKFCYKIDNTYRYGLVFFPNQNENPVSEFGFNLVGIHGKKIIMACDNKPSELQFCNIDVENINNEEKINDKFYIATPVMDFYTIHNQYKSLTEKYIHIAFLNSDHVFVLSYNKNGNGDETINKYILELTTNEWVDYTLIENTDEFKYENNEDSNMMFVLDYKKEHNNVWVISIISDKVYIKTITFPVHRNMAPSKFSQQIGYYKDNVFYTQTYKDLFEQNNIFEEHKIPLEEKEFITAADISKSKYIIGTTHNIYIKNIGESDDLWQKVNYEFPQNLIINEITENKQEEYYDMTNKIWSNFISKDDKIIAVSLDGKSFHIKESEGNYNLIDIQLYPLLITPFSLKNGTM